MNVTRTPETSDPEALARRYPHIDDNGKKKEAKKDAKKQRPKSPIRKEKREFATKTERRRVKESGTLAMPVMGAAPSAPVPTAKSKPKAKKPADDDDEEDEGEDLLLVEYPDGGGPKSKSRDFSPAFPSVQRKFDDFMDQRESEADDADDESLNESDADFELPPAVTHPAQEPEAMDLDRDEEEEEQGGDMEDDMEDDLEKDLAEAFEQDGDDSSPAAREDHGDESEISEED